MKDVNAFFEFYGVKSRLISLGFEIQAYYADSENKCKIICKHLLNSLVVDIAVECIDDWYWNSTTDEDEHVEGVIYDMRVNNGFWYSAKDRQDLFKRLTEVSEYKV